MDLHIPNSDWTTTASHPYSGTSYQEARMEGDGTWARVTRNGAEVVSPSRDTDAVYKQYNGRVQRIIRLYEDH